MSWVDHDHAVLGGVDCVVVGGTHTSRAAQMHFYMEPQSAVASPGEGRQITVLSSTQNPDTVHGATSAALGLDSNEVEVQIRRVGGGYGGKAMRSPWAATNAAIAATKLARPVKLTLQRDVDSALFGHENPLRGDYRIAVGTGIDADGNPDPHSLGRLLGMHAELYVDAGNTADCTPIVLDCVQLRFDNAYMIPNYHTSGKVCLTNTTSNTSFRSLDAISGITILEDGIEAAAHELGLLAEDVRCPEPVPARRRHPVRRDPRQLLPARRLEVRRRAGRLRAPPRCGAGVQPRQPVGQAGHLDDPDPVRHGLQHRVPRARRRTGRHLRRRRHGDRASRRRRDRAGVEHPGDPARRPRAEHPDAPGAHRRHVDGDHPQPGGHRRQHGRGVQRRCGDEGGGRAAPAPGELRPGPAQGARAAVVHRPARRLLELRRRLAGRRRDRIGQAG